MTYGYKSVPKPAKGPDIQMSNIFAKYDRSNWTAHKELEKPAKEVEPKYGRSSWISEIKSNTIRVKCIYCKKEYSVPREKSVSLKICVDCDKLST
jgi:hypothetical protein